MFFLYVFWGAFGIVNNASPYVVVAFFSANSDLLCFIVRPHIRVADNLDANVPPAANGSVRASYRLLTFVGSRKEL